MANSASAKFGVCVILGLVLTISTGFVYGRLSQRWGPVPDLLAAAEHLKTFPSRLGEWEVAHDKPIDDDTLRMLESAGYVHREYINRQTGDRISMFIIVGPSGPTAVHTPEICYSSSGYTVQGNRRAVTISADADGQSGTFWTNRFRSNNVLTTQNLSVCYAWNDGSGWQATESPRFEFGGRPMLYKIQLAAFVSGSTPAEARSPGKDFITEMLNSGWKVDVGANVEDQR